MQRTIDSADSQLDGLFDLDLAFPNSDPRFIKNVIQDDEDFDLHTTADNCKRLDQVITSAQESSAFVLVQSNIDSVMEEWFFPRLR